MLAVKAELLSGVSHPLALTGQRKDLAVEGMGGVGKTMLAAALARDPDVHSAFPDGVFWLTLGQTPEDALSVQARLIRAVGGQAVTLDGIEHGRERLRELMGARTALLVLDDVWRSEDAEPFRAVEGRSRLLVTTRKDDVARALDAEPVALGELPNEDALALLVQYARVPREALPGDALAIVRECGNLPLAIAMAGSLLRGSPPNRWDTLVQRLRAAEIGHIEVKLPQYAHRSLAAALELSLHDLGEDHEDLPARYVDLAVFPKGAPIPEAALATYWAAQGMDAGNVQDAIDTFIDRSLARRDAVGRLVLHDLQHDYVTGVAGDLTPLHARLLDAYRRSGAAEGFHAAPDDGYFFEHVARHVLAAEGGAALRALLLDVRWLRAKLHATGVSSLVSDFALLGEGAADGASRLVRDTLRLSAHVLNRRPSELCPQLVGRLVDADGTCDEQGLRDLEALVDAARAQSPRPAVVPDRARLASPGGPLLATLPGHAGAVRSVAMSSDGRLALSGSEDKTVKVWDVSAGRVLHTLEGHTGAVRSVALSRDATLALSCSDDMTLRLWSLTEGRPIRTFAGSTSWIRTVALSSDAKLAFSASMRLLQVWDVSSGRQLRSFEPHAGHLHFLCAALSATGKVAVSGSGDGTPRVWDVESGRLIKELEPHAAEVTAIALSADGTRAVSGSADGRLKVWDVEAGRRMHILEGKAGVSALALSVDGRKVVVGYDDRTLAAWDLSGRQPVASEETGLLAGWDNLGRRIAAQVFGGHAGVVRSIALSTDGRTALSGSGDTTLKVWRLATETGVAAAPEAPRAHLSRNRMRLSYVGHAGAVRTVSCSSGSSLALSGSTDGTLKLWDVATGKVKRTVEAHSGWVQSVALSGDGTRAVSASSEATLRVWDTASGRLVRTLAGHAAAVRSVALSTDGELALSGSSDRTLKLWDTTTGALLETMAGHMGAVRAVALSADGALGISGSRDWTLKVWHPSTGRLVRTLEGHHGEVLCVALTPDGRRAVSGSADRTMKLWDVATGELLRTFENPSGAVQSVALSTDAGMVLSTGSDDRGLMLLYIASGVATSFTGDAAYLCVALAADCRRALAGDDRGEVHAFDVLAS
jgi:WD40 repeat protein